MPKAHRVLLMYRPVPHVRNYRSCLRHELKDEVIGVRACYEFCRSPQPLKTYRDLGEDLSVNFSTTGSGSRLIFQDRRVVWVSIHA